jgi:putative transposase
MILTIKYKLNPTKVQIETFDQWLGGNRYLYNVALEERITAYKSLGKSVTKYDQYNQLPEIKKEFTWLKEIHSQVLQNTLERLDKSYQSFFNGNGFPKFRKKDNYNSFTFPSGIKIIENQIKLPKIGLVKFINHRSISNCKTATIIQNRDKWYISITFEVQEPSTIVDNSNAVGIDVGVVNHSTLSDNTINKPNQFLEINLKQLRILNRKLSRQIRGSSSYLKTKKQLSKLHEKISNQRKDYNHKLSTNIVKNYSAIYVEDLKISNMIKLNSTLARRIADNAWFQFRTFLTYKSKLAGKHFYAVNPAYTSQQCSSCAAIDKKSRLSQSEYCCTSCGYIDNADKNAAKNIKVKGQNLST